jgi:class 3 adenylate cyclase
MRRQLTATLVLAVIGFVSGVLYRHTFDPPNEADLANYLRSATHGSALALTGWAVHLHFTSRDSEWVRRWPLAVELVVRSLVMAGAIAGVAMLLEMVLYSHLPDPHWLANDLPRILLIAFVTSAIVGGIYELIRLIGGRVLLNVMIGRYRRPVREQRVLLFLDLAGSTALAEQMGEVRVQDLLTRFFYDIDRAITGHGGEVHAYVGDEVIVTWRAADGRSQRRCLDCFFAIRDRIGELAEIYRREFGLVPDFRAGLHAGPVVISECGDSRRQVAYFGDTVNVTARLQALAKDAGLPLIVSRDFLHLTEQGKSPLAPAYLVEALGPKHCAAAPPRWKCFRWRGAGRKTREPTLPANQEDDHCFLV